ncbi:MAG: hypothetical protein HRT61_17130 [Ekhidna sp.]|nr:hypothetical protein [Ekhidna sp.]
MKPKNRIHPPKWADASLSWFCADEVVETLRGDLYELYQMRRESSSKFSADIGL